MMAHLIRRILDWPSPRLVTSLGTLSRLGHAEAPVRVDPFAEWWSRTANLQGIACQTKWARLRVRTTQRCFLIFLSMLDQLIGSMHVRDSFVLFGLKVHLGMRGGDMSGKGLQSKALAMYFPSERTTVQTNLWTGFYDLGDGSFFSTPWINCDSWPQW